MFGVSRWLAFGSRKGHFGFYIHAILSVHQLMFEVSLWLVFGSRKGHFGFYFKCPGVNVWGVPSVGVRESRGTLWFYIHAFLSVLQLMFEVSLGWCSGVERDTLVFILNVLALMFGVPLWLAFGSRTGHFAFIFMLS
jgi:hypothetical protein